MKILTFIGGSGFIGKSFLDAFKRGVLDEFKISKINVISRKPYKLKKNKELLSKKIKLIRGNIKSIKKIPKSDIIIYGAENVDPKYYKNIKGVISKLKSKSQVSKVKKNYGAKPKAIVTSSINEERYLLLLILGCEKIVCGGFEENIIRWFLSL